jgi:hypothetical protein
VTWKEFVQSVEARGVMDDDVIAFIDYSPTDDDQPPRVTFYREDGIRTRAGDRGPLRIEVI